MRLARATTRVRSEHEVFCRASQAYIKVVIIGIDGRRSSRKVRPYAYRTLGEMKTPGLHIVIIRSECRVPDDFRQAVAQRGTQRRHGVLIIGGRSHACEARPYNTSASRQCSGAADENGSPVHALLLGRAAQTIDGVSGDIVAAPQRLSRVA
jgi:hypothetical protein